MPELLPTTQACFMDGTLVDRNQSSIYARTVPTFHEARDMAKVAVLLTERFADWEYALIGGTGGPFYGIEIRYFGITAGEIRSQGGLSVNVSSGLQDVADWRPDAIAVVGGMIWETPKAPDIADLLMTRHQQDGIVAGICGGTLPIARTGLLNKARHTSNDREFLIRHVPNYTGSDHYVADPVAVSDQRVITAPGTAPVTFTAAIFEAIGVDPEGIEQLRSMLAAEHLHSV